MHAIACTEHGNLYHWAAKKWYAEDKGLKFIHGIEAYVTKSLSEKVRDNYHVVLLAKNIQGMYEINRLASSAFNKEDGHFYYNPRISFDQLLSTTDNVIVLTACLGGILNSEDAEIKFRFLRFLIDHRDRCFLEVQPHQVMDQVEYNRELAKLSAQYGIRLVATTDVHGLDQRAMDARDIGQRARNTHFDSEEGWTLTFKSGQEMFAAFKAQGALTEEQTLEAMASTETIASMCESYALDDSIKYPDLFDNPVERLRQEAYAAIDTHPHALKYNTREEIIARIDYEVDACAAIGAAQYLLMFKAQSDWEHEHGIFTGPGRGSAAGSEINYLFGITEMNPLRFGLSFDRFINKDRVSLPDIDRDYYDTDRAIAKEHALKDHMGFEKLKSAEIITFGTCQLRKAIDDVCRALGLGLEVGKEIKGEIVSDDDGVEYVPDPVREKYPEVFRYVDSLIGVVVSVGVHAAGVLLTDYDIASYIGLSATKDSPYMSSMLDMKELDRLNYIKLDFLGLQNVGLKNKVEQRAGIPRITPDTIDLEDEAVWKSIRDDTTLIFQWESKSASAFLRKFMSDATLNKVKARNKNLSMLKWFSFGNGLLRPACASYRDDVAVGEFYDNGFDELNDFLLQEAGHLCMQESIMAFLVEFCNYTKSESDTVRRAIAKRAGTEKLLPEIEGRFIETTPKKFGISESEAAEIIKPFIRVIQDASSYAFSWNHSDPYSFIGYALGYLRYYYPLAFFSVALDLFGDDKEKTAEIIKCAAKQKIRVYPARFGKSGSMYTPDPDHNAVYKGMASIAYMNDKLPDQLLALTRDHPCNTFVEALQLLSQTSINSRQIDILIELDFFSAFGNIPTLQHIYELFSTTFKSGLAKSIAKEKLGDSPVGRIVAKHSRGTRKDGSEAASYTILDMPALLKDVEMWVRTIGYSDMPVRDKIEKQTEYMGYADVTTGREEDRRKLVVLDMFPLKSKGGGEPWAYKLTTQSLGSGKQSQLTLRKRKYDQQPVKKYDVIYVWSCPKDKKGYFDLVSYDVLRENEI